MKALYATAAVGTLVIVIGIFGISGCRPRNSGFNPFDDEFVFHGNFRLADYDTLRGECGYWNLTRKVDRIETYYQFFEDERKIVAKGFNLDIDEIPVSGMDTFRTETDLIRMLEKHPIDFSELKDKLQKFGIVNIMPKGHANYYTPVDLIDGRDSVYTAHISFGLKDGMVKRRLDYFNARPGDD